MLKILMETGSKKRRNFEDVAYEYGFMKIELSS
jgi:hypothetical protein